VYSQLIATGAFPTLHRDWKAQIVINGRRIGLGIYGTYQSAIDAINNSKELHDRLRTTDNRAEQGH